MGIYTLSSVLGRILARVCELKYDMSPGNKVECLIETEGWAHGKTSTTIPVGKMEALPYKWTTSVKSSLSIFCGGIISPWFFRFKSCKDWCSSVNPLPSSCNRWKTSLLGRTNLRQLGWRTVVRKGKDNFTYWLTYLSPCSLLKLRIKHQSRVQF